jgi:hypothetical protein
VLKLKLEIRPLTFDNVLTYSTNDLRTNWQEGIFIMEDITLAEGVYKNGPIFFSVEPQNGEKKFGRFTYYLPINERVHLKNTTEFQFQERFHIDEALVLRQADQEVDFYAAHRKIKDYAMEENIAIEDTFYCVLLEVYGDIIIDLYVPIKKSGETKNDYS